MRAFAVQPRVRRASLDSGELLTAAEVAKLAGFSLIYPTAQPRIWASQKRIFAVRHNDADY